MVLLEYSGRRNWKGHYYKRSAHNKKKKGNYFGIIFRLPFKTSYFLLLSSWSNLKDRLWGDDNILPPIWLIWWSLKPHTYLWPLLQYREKRLILFISNLKTLNWNASYYIASLFAFFFFLLILACSWWDKLGPGLWYMKDRVSCGVWNPGHEIK